MHDSRRGTRRIGRLSLAGLLLVATACSGSDGSGVTEATPSTTTLPGGRDVSTYSVVPDYEAPTFFVNVTFTDTGFEPETVHIPAGRQVRLVLRNRGSLEHHYRVVGLAASEVRWLMVPEVDEEEQLEMEAESGFVDDADHILHHLEPQFVPFKPASLSGIRPLPGEVHAYAQTGTSDVVLFFPLEVGTFIVEDVRHPEITGRVIVFDPGD